MNAERLLQYYKTIADAPDAIARLRRFVLDLAVRGKLVPQDSADEPASELLRRIAEEKARLVEFGSRRADKPVKQSFKKANRYRLPALWQWVDLQALCLSITDGDHLPPPKADEGVPFLVIGDVRSKKINYGCDRYVGRAYYEKLDVIRRPRKGDILYTLVGSFGIPVPVEEDREFCVQRHIGILRPYGSLSGQFLTYTLESDLVLGQAGAFATGIAQKTVPLAGLRAIQIPLPPLAEQHRIVTKVDELMALCDQLEGARATRETTRDRLAAASLARLNSPDSATFQDDARFALEAMPALTARPDQVKQLRQTIFNLAVRGKLVPQNPTDRPAAELLEGIADEKAQLVKIGGLKKDKEYWDGLSNEPPYVLPHNWNWARLQDVFEISRGGSPRPAGDPKFFGGSTPWITVQEITKDIQKYLIKTSVGLTDEGVRRSRTIEPGDLLLTNSGATLGVPKISKIRGCINDGVAVLRQFHTVSMNDFCHLYLHSQTLAFRSVNQGMGQPNLNTPIIAGWFIPIPPLAEQHRIVAKVDELMALCDQLEASLTTADETRRRLLDALLAEALAPVKAENLQEAAE
ncbi:restriction endonuclease subunit S [Rhizobium sp. P32RR-XVIII]|uniref:restriction endonuclease subunit S n=1 Tax=Rhizobium sp. P32RR-XVIII TaxID=2726738 RepID=UPI0014564662|nr:restriction endonuclease subunit S [Rhizobium sp. P32RR-XVIII]NLS07657.1 restriction endonuclease subunit S [Rhizobium sp. P32RR-XVIII]